MQQQAIKLLWLGFCLSSWNSWAAQGLAQNLTETDTLQSVTISSTKPRKILAKAVENIALNYPTEASTKPFTLNYTLLEDTTGKKIIDFDATLGLYLPAYWEKSNYLEACLLADRKRVDRSQTLPRYVNYGYIQVSDLILNSVLLTELPFLKNSGDYRFELLSQQEKDGLIYDEIGFEPQKKDKSFSYSGAMWIEQKSHAFVWIDFTLLTHKANKKFQSVRSGYGLGDKSNLYFTHFNSQHFVVNFARKDSLWELETIVYQDRLRFGNKNLKLDIPFTSDALVQHADELLSEQKLVEECRPFSLNKLKDKDHNKQRNIAISEKSAQKRLVKISERLKKISNRILEEDWNY